MADQTRLILNDSPLARRGVGVNLIRNASRPDAAGGHPILPRERAIVAGYPAPAIDG